MEKLYNDIDIINALNSAVDLFIRSKSMDEFFEIVDENRFDFIQVIEEEVKSNLMLDDNIKRRINVFQSKQLCSFIGDIIDDYTKDEWVPEGTLRSSFEYMNVNKAFDTSLSVAIFTEVFIEHLLQMRNVSHGCKMQLIHLVSSEEFKTVINNNNLFYIDDGLLSKTLYTYLTNAQIKIKTTELKSAINITFRHSEVVIFVELMHHQ